MRARVARAVGAIAWSARSGARTNDLDAAAERRRLVQVVVGVGPEPVHPSWRPFHAERDVIEERRSGFDYGKTYADDGTTYYWLDTGDSA